MKTINNIRYFFGGLMLFICISINAQITIESLEIQKSETQTVQAGTTINNLIVHADKYGCGQLKIESGIAKVKNFTLKYNIVPAEWSPISFPIDINDITAPSVSNLLSLGLIYNNQSMSNVKKSLLKSFNTVNKSNNVEPWVTLTTPSVTANTGYFIAVVTGSTTPIDLEFYYSNISLDNSKLTNRILIDVDMNGKIANYDYPVSITTTNVKSNTLNVTIHNEPTGGTSGIDYQKAIEQAEIYFTENKSGFRIALPTTQHCKVLIMDSKLKKVYKALDYEAPAIIPVNDLKKKGYKLYLEYGNGKDIKDLNL